MNFCEECGQRLVQTKSLSHYDSEWGSPRWRFTRTCPNRRWWNSHHAKVHFVGRDEADADRAQDFQWHGR